MPVKPTARKPRTARTRERRPQERPEEIGLAALRSFSARGYHETTIDDIAAGAGVTKGAVYHHFENKEQVLEYALKVYFDRAFLAIGAARPQPGGVLEFIREGVLGAAVQLWTAPEFSALFCLALGDVGQLFPAVRQGFLQNGPLRGWGELARAIRRGQQEGLLRRDVSSEAAARLVTSSVAMQCLLRRGMGDSSQQQKKAAREAVDTALKLLTCAS